MAVSSPSAISRSRPCRAWTSMPSPRRCGPAGHRRSGHPRRRQTGTARTRRPARRSRRRPARIGPARRPPAPAAPLLPVGDPAAPGMAFIVLLCPQPLIRRALAAPRRLAAMAWPVSVATASIIRPAAGDRQRHRLGPDGHRRGRAGEDRKVEDRAEQRHQRQRAGRPRPPTAASTCGSASAMTSHLPWPGRGPWSTAGPASASRGAGGQHQAQQQHETQNPAAAAAAPGRRPRRRRAAAAPWPGWRARAAGR